MDKTFFLSLSVVFAAVAFFGVCWWAFSPSRRKKFDEAANLPFADSDRARHHPETDISGFNTEGQGKVNL